MKLIIAGASGFVSSEIIRQSLHIPQITEVVALARKPVRVPKDVDASKLKSIVVEDYSTYPEELREELAGAQACIWTVAITPSKSKAYNFEDVRRVCQTWTLDGLKAIYEAGPAKPFRFIYMSGIAAERDQTKIPKFMPPYTLMRGETENQVLNFAAQHKPEVEAYVMKPGLITKRGEIGRTLSAMALKWLSGVPNVDIEHVVASMLQVATKGSERDTLINDELSTLGATVIHDYN